MDSIIVTSTAKEFDPVNPDPGLICIEDIARGLSRTCRYTGQLKPEREFYSVAQHSVLATRWAMSVCVAITSPQMAKRYLSILLHDASEAYLSDISSPVKRELPDYRAIEAELQDTIFKKFTGQGAWYSVYNMYDKYAYWLEIKHVMPPHPKLDEWATTVPERVPEIVTDIISQTWYPYRAYAEFMQLWLDLTSRILE